jgi:hypothetical protein
MSNLHRVVVKLFTGMGDAKKVFRVLKKKKVMADVAAAGDGI